MAVQYWVGGFFVDLSRNQITQNYQSQNKRSQIIAPKALAVLTYLAENQGRVVSHDELLDKVWHGTVVTPNTLQRSIAQLRKALGDDGKGQVYIQTHAKQGYSLECDVRWHDCVNTIEPGSVPNNTNEESSISEAGITQDIGITDSANKLQRSIPGLRLFSVASVIIILSVIGFQFFGSDQVQQTTPTSTLTFDTLRSLTATDDKEFDASYSPDGEYIIFHRYLDLQCGNKLWAKNITTHEEIQLTQDWGAYGRHSFSEDGKTLVFIETYACSEPPVAQKDCYDLVSLDFQQALQSPQQPSVMLQCKNSMIDKPQWLSDDNIALMQNTSNRWKLIDYSIRENNSTDLYAIEDGSVIDYTYSAGDHLIAVTSIHSDGQHYIDMLKPDGSILSSHPIERPPEIAQFRSLHPVFDSLNKQLIFSTGKQLFTLSYEGKVERISLPFAEIMMPTEFQPQGKSLLLIKGRYDSDIVRLSLNQIAEKNPLVVTPQFEKIESATNISQQRPPQLIQPENYSIFERSRFEDGSAIFQPNGELIAFLSERSGDEQIWISDGSGPRQLTQLPMDSTIQGFDWAADGNSLLISANHVLTQVFLDSSQQRLHQRTIGLDHPIALLYQWDSNNDAALALVRKNGVLKFAEVDLNNSQIREISDKDVLWALKTADGRLIYKDYMGRFWKPGPAEPQHIDVLDNQGGKSKSFVINGNVIFAINNENQLWSYDLDTESFEVLGEVSDDIVSLTDINREQVLMTVLIAEKKEVVELSLRE